MDASAPPPAEAADPARWLSVAAFLGGAAVAGYAFNAFFLWCFDRCSSKDYMRRHSIASSYQSMDIACKTVSGCFGAASWCTGIYLFVESLHSQPDYTNPFLKVPYCVSVAYFTYDIWAMFRVHRERARQRKQHRGSRLWADFLRARPLIVAHHVAIAALTLLMALKRRHDPGQLMVAAALTFEGSTPFVSYRAVLAYQGRRDGALYKLNGLAMLASFFCCRVLVYPVFTWAYGAQRGISFLSAAASIPAFPCGLTMLLVLLPQLHWLRIMSSGAVRVLRGEHAGNGDGDDGDGRRQQKGDCRAAAAGATATTANNNHDDSHDQQKKER